MKNIILLLGLIMLMKVIFPETKTETKASVIVIQKCTTQSGVICD